MERTPNLCERKKLTGIIISEIYVPCGALIILCRLEEMEWLWKSMNPNSCTGSTTVAVTDKGISYNALPNHSSVNHSLHFVDPNDSTIHTNTVEGMWSHIKMKYRNMHGTSNNLFSTYLQEFSWRHYHTNNVFMNFMKCVREYYPT